MGLDDASTWRFDNSGKSIAYFALKSPVLVDRAIIGELRMASEKHGNGNVRICLHKSPSDLFHTMIILEHQHKKCRVPHKHHSCDEILQIYEGRMMYLAFGEDGAVLDKSTMEPEGKFMGYSPRGMFHLYLPMTDYVIYSESKNGPFQRNDIIFPEWDHKKILEQHVDFMNLECPENCGQHTKH